MSHTIESHPLLTAANEKIDCEETTVFIAKKVLMLLTGKAANPPFQLRQVGREVSFLLVKDEGVNSVWLCRESEWMKALAALIDDILEYRIDLDLGNLYADAYDAMGVEVPILWDTGATYREDAKTERELLVSELRNEADGEEVDEILEALGLPSGDEILEAAAMEPANDD